MAVQVAVYEYIHGTTTAALLDAWITGLTIASVLGTWAIPVSNTKTMLVFAYKDA